MAELPEIKKISRQMDETLRNKKISGIEILQEKCVNASVEDWNSRILGQKVLSVGNKGKWFRIGLTNGENILMSLGMGGDVLYFDNPENTSAKYQIKMNFTDGTGFTVRFWWFGKFLLLNDGELADDPNTNRIAPDAFDECFTYEYLDSLMKGKKVAVKTFLMDQKNIGGIGNMYMHDILFLGSLHPQRKISDMDETDRRKLYDSISEVLRLSERKGSFAHELDFFGQKGDYTTKDFLVGYKENQPCPRCGEKIKLIKTGSTTSFICPVCQK